MTNKIDIIKNRLLAYEDRNAVHAAMLKRQKKLKNLVEKHGMECVCLAGGYAKSTLDQYLRTNEPRNIGKENLDKAIHILKNL